MASFGGFGVFPVELGGAPGAAQKAYGALRGMLGEGAVSDDGLEVTTIDGAWHAALAQGLAAIDSVDEAAHWQGFPSTVTDELESYEETLFGSPGAGEDEERRRQRVEQQWVAKARADYPEMTQALDRIDERFSLLTPDHDTAATTVPGKVLDELTVADGAGTFSFDGRICSLWPLYSTDLVVDALLDIGEGVLPSGELDRAIEAARDYLDRTLPAWCDFSISTDTGFILGASRVDLTALGP